MPIFIYSVYFFTGFSWIYPHGFGSSLILKEFDSELHQIVKINVAHISANGLSVDCSLYVKYRNSLGQVFEIYPRVIVEI